jgi:kumamolisin
MSSPAQKRVVLPRSERGVPANAKQIGRTDPKQVLSVSVIVKRKNPLDLHALAGQRVSREDFDAQFAADPASFDALRGFAHEQGLTVDEAASSLSRRTLVLRGPAQAMEQAFGVELHDYKDAKTKKRYHCFTGQVTMPETHAPLVEAVLGLDARPIARAHFRYLKNLKKKKKPRATAQPAPFNPPQVAALYNFPTGVNGAGQTIGLIELGGGYTTSDVTTYFGGLGIKAPTVVAVSVDGGTNAPGDPNGADGEVALDIQVAGSIAPGAKIAVYFAPNTDQGFIDAITTAVHDTTNQPSVISIELGAVVGDGAGRCVPERSGAGADDHGGIGGQRVIRRGERRREPCGLSGIEPACAGVRRDGIDRVGIDDCVGDGVERRHAGRGYGGRVQYAVSAAGVADGGRD